MDLHPRYEIIGPIASGDFATVYRARDKELERDVAIKQIHPHFLNDPRRLDSFWREAQLLASLAHPNVMTIYDIVRERGWLILELMQGQLQQYAAGNPLPPEILRPALAGTLEALEFLHRSGITHGDVKPTNLLIDRLNRIKLGDFGLARRAASDQGSLIKGTTQYMAPELVSPGFGEVGPASDLYSLGFSIYQLAVGQQQFEDLFPGLDAFGADRQIAWIMWHGAADRQAPPLERVVPDFPPDLAAVIHKLMAKPQAQRYATAAEALQDLHVPTGSMPVNSEEEEELALARAARQKRYFAIGAFATSAILCLAVLLWPPKKQVVELPQERPAAISGIVRQVTPARQIVVVEVDEDGVHKEVEVRLGEHHRVFLNDQASLLRDLAEQDVIAIHTITDEEGRDIYEVHAARARDDSGTIAEIKLDEGTLLVASSDAQHSKPLLLAVTPATRILINDRESSSAPYGLADLQVGDKVVVRHAPLEAGREAREIRVTRQLAAAGILAKVDIPKRELSWTEQEGETLRDPRVLKVADACEISLNDQRLVGGRVLTLADLSPGDHIKLSYDRVVHRIDARRTFEETGTIREIAYGVRSLEVTLPERAAPVTFVAPADCLIKLGSEEIAFDDLRRGDQLQMVHESPDGNNIQLREITASRPADPSKWALLILQAEYDDAEVAQLDYLAGDRAAIQTALVERYGVLPEQVLVLANESRIRLSRAIPEALQKAAGAKELFVLFAGHAAADDAGKVFLASKDFDHQRIAESGVPLDWFIKQLEASPVPEKVLLFDGSHVSEGKAALTQASAAEMIETIRGTRSRPGLKTTTVIAAGATGEQDHRRTSDNAGAFGFAVAEAFRGQADKDRNLRITPSELFESLERSLAGARGEALHPTMFLPNDSPPRLTDEAIVALRGLGAILRQNKIDPTEAREAFAKAKELSGAQPEAPALYSLILIKNRQFDEAQRLIEETKAAHPNFWPLQEADIWCHFSDRQYRLGVKEMTDLVARLAAAKSLPAGSDLERMFVLIGKLREFAEKASDDRSLTPEAIAALDVAVSKLGAAALEPYGRGREASLRVISGFDKNIADATDRLDISKHMFERRQMRHYITFSFDSLADAILAKVDE